MRLSAFALSFITLSTVSAFSPVAPSSAGSVGSVPSAELVDKSLRGIDSDAKHDVYDPLGGSRPPLTRNNNDQVWVPQVGGIPFFTFICIYLSQLTRLVQRARPRRNRKSAAVREMVRENIVLPSNFIYPLFIHDESFNTPIPSMPGCVRHSLDSMLREVGDAWKYGVKTFVLFPKVPDHLKTNLGVEAYNPNGIVHRAIRLIKATYPDSVVCTDVALDPYSSMGHDGVVEKGKILNDVTINQLCKQAVSQAKAGADIVAPSDMMVR
jgi:porphobilinogen synthase